MQNGNTTQQVFVSKTTNLLYGLNLMKLVLWQLYFLFSLLMVSDVGFAMTTKEQAPPGQARRGIWQGFRINIFRKKHQERAAKKNTKKSDVDKKKLGIRPRLKRPKNLEKRASLGYSHEHLAFFSEPVLPLSGTEETKLILMADQLVSVIRKTNVAQAFRETSPELNSFIDAIPKDFFRSLYTLIRIAYEEMNSLEAVESAKEHDLLTHDSVRSHRNLYPLIADQSIRKLLVQIESGRPVLEIILPILFDEILRENDQSMEKSLAYLFNFLGFQALAVDNNAQSGLILGRYVADNDREQEIYRKLKRKMIKLIAIDGHGLLINKNFFTNKLGSEQSSPLAKEIYEGLMTFFQECVQHTVERH